MAQMLACPNGYYLVSNNLCYPIQQQLQPQAATQQDIQNCKIAKYMIAADT